jgi:lantibiotic modifying enzyme
VHAGLHWTTFWPTLGGTSGLGSAVLGLSWIGSLLGDSAYAASARLLAAQVTEDDVDRHGEADIERGLAGYLLALLSVAHTFEDDDRERRLRQVERRLLDLGRIEPNGGLGWPALDGRTHAGFAHGAGGIAVALARRASATGSPGALDAVRAAWRSERRLFAEHGGQWPYVGSAGAPVVMAGWCHGAPGIALARVAAPQDVWDEEVSGEIAAAIAATLRSPAARLDHLCCGTLSRVEALFTAGRLIGDSSVVEQAEARAGQLALRILEEGPEAVRTAGFETGQFRAGFFQGLAGIGYQLLRVAEPERVPSVLAFQSAGVLR